ncbi:MAG TPA: hypothetical protein VIT23_02140, partial [Terrimicrobiaceae bacterium]
MSTQAAPSAASTVKTIGVQSRSNLREYGLMIALVVIMVLFQFLTNGTLFKPLNLTNLVLQNSYIVVMALGMLLVIVAGHIDLSVGSVAGFIGALSAVFMVRLEMHFLPATILCLIAGGLIGAAQGYWIAYLKIPSFIVTLAGMLVFRGLTLALLAGQSIGPFPKQFQLLSSGFIFDYPPGGFREPSFVLGVVIAAAMFYTSLRTRLNRQKHGFHGSPLWVFILEHGFISALFIYFSYLLASYNGIPNVLVVMGILIILFVFVTTRTTIG